MVLSFKISKIRIKSEFAIIFHEKLCRLYVFLSIFVPLLLMIASQLILWTLIGYVGLQLVVAMVAAKGADNAVFFTASRRVPWYVAWPAMISAAMSGITFVSVPGSVATDGFSYLQMVAGFTVGQCVLAFWLVPLFYRWGYRSIYEYFGDRFGAQSHRVGGWFFFLSKLAASALKLYVVVTVLQVLLFDGLGVPFWVNVTLTVVVVWLSTWRGGVRSVLAVDLVKTACMLAALLVTIYCIARSFGWSLPAIWQEVTVSPMSQIFFLDDPASDRYFWKMFVSGVVLLIAMTGLDQDMMQRNLACRSQRDAQRNILLTALCQAVVIVLFLVLGVLLYRYADRVGMTLPEQGDDLFPQVALSGGLPSVVTILFVLGFAAASFSSAGSALTALTTSFLLDVMRSKELDEIALQRQRRWVHAGMALSLFGLVCLFGYVANESAINLIYRVAGYTYGPILGMFLFGLWTKYQVRDRWTWLPAVVAPIISALLQMVAERYWGVEIGFELLLYNAVLVMAGLWLLRRKTTA